MKGDTWSRGRGEKNQVEKRKGLKEQRKKRREIGVAEEGSKRDRWIRDGANRERGWGRGRGEERQGKQRNRMRETS
jgi:hypothetical protein